METGWSRGAGRFRAGLACAIVALALAASATLHLRGSERDLPDALDVDEIFLFRPAMRIAADGDGNPHWFGYPASTVIYPLAALLRVQRAVLHDAAWTGPDPGLRFAFLAGDFAPYVRTGRWLSIAYGVATIAVAALLAWRWLGPEAAAATAILATASPVAVAHAQTLRSDSAAAFWGLVFLLLVLRARERPTTLRQALAGAALGLAVASRYLMASVGLVLALVQLGTLRADGPRDARTWRAIATAWLAAAASFLAATPYLLLDAGNAWRGVVAAAGRQVEHTGIDRLGFAGNLRFYVADAIPDALGMPQAVLAVLGLLVLGRRRDRTAGLAAAYVASFVAGIALLGIHWQRWVIPVLPVLSLLASAAVVAAAARCSRRVPAAARSAVACALVLAAAVAAAWLPARRAIADAELNAAPSTELHALDWVLANVPDGSRIAYEWYTAPLTAQRARGKRYRLLGLIALGRRTLDTYRQDGWEYLLVSSHMYGRYTRDPASHPKEAEFYRRLRAEAELLHEVGPSDSVRGPAVAIFRLPPGPVP